MTSPAATATNEWPFRERDFTETSLNDVGGVVERVAGGSGAALLTDGARSGAEGLEWRYEPSGKENYTLSMAYDAIHNIESKTQTHTRTTPGESRIEQHKTTYDFSYAYTSSHPHAPTNIGDRTFRYDDSGNQLGWDHDRNGQRRRIEWDDENRIQNIFDNGRESSYKYNDAGERVIKRTRQGETAYVNQFWTVRNRSVGTKHVYIGESRLVSKLSPGEAHVNPPGGRSNNPDLLQDMVNKWLPLWEQTGDEPGSNVDKNPHFTGCVPPRCDSVMPDSTGLPDANFVYFYHPDHLGSTSFVTDKDGELYEHVLYFPFGETWVQEASNKERMPYLFTSKELDEETGLYYFGARYYDPRTSVWGSADPALARYLPLAPGEQGLALPAQGGAFVSGNLALYGYVRNDPIQLVDPTGKWSSKRALFGIWQPVHQQAIAQVLGDKVGPKALRILQRQQEVIDAKQRPEDQPMHAMTGGTAVARHGLAKARTAAIAEANRFVGDSLSKAQALLKAGRVDAAYERLGDAIHTLQDATSPSHRGFQVWGYYDPSASPEERKYFSAVAEHALVERVYPGSGSRERQELEGATRWAWEIFTGQREAPERFFDPKTGLILLPQEYTTPHAQ